MKIITYVFYALWIATCITLKILGYVGWWVALSWLWFPLALLLTIIVGINLAVLIGRRLQDDQLSEQSCDNCIFGKTAKYSESGRCLGEELGEERGKVCQYYRKAR